MRDGPAAKEPDIKEDKKMQVYWDIISNRHQAKLKVVALKKGIALNTAMRNIVNYLKGDNACSGRPDYLRELITAKEIEEMIDIIVLQEVS